MSYSECVAGGVGVCCVRLWRGGGGGGGRAGGTRRRALSACGRAVLAARAHTRT